MYIGYMGSVTFVVSSHYMLTPSKFQQGTSARWQEHEVIFHKPVSEFLGPGQKTVSFDIILSAQHNINPAKEIKTLMNMCENGEVFPLIIGGKPVSSNYWRLESVSVGDTYYTATGKMTHAVVSVSLKEYDDSNYKEEQAKRDLYGAVGNALASLF
ncbi:phage tail protein [Selenomonas sp. AE3005]|uniref:phage tail protein n=1 Tax=Selenomonas sp. AE3005 TaxID=1485543 RepID=UPI0025F85EB0|nr:phage tail protein [Selenomonas sp. AE3005]